MILERKIRNVNQIGIINDRVICSIKEDFDGTYILYLADKIYEVNDMGLCLVLEHPIYHFIPFDKGFLFQEDSKRGNILYYDFHELIVWKASASMAPIYKGDSKNVFNWEKKKKEIRVSEKSIDDETIHYRVIGDEWTELHRGFEFGVLYRSPNLKIIQKEAFIQANNPSRDEFLWKRNIAEFGRRIVRRSGDIISDKVNKVNRLQVKDSMAFLYMSGGQIFALSTDNGQEIWKYETLNNDIRPRLYQESIYAYFHREREVREIDCRNGKVVKKVSIRDVFQGKFFPGGGPFIVYDDIILLVYTSGKILMLSRYSLEIICEIETDIHISNSDMSIIWHNKKLYVQSLDKTELHIFS